MPIVISIRSVGVASLRDASNRVSGITLRKTPSSPFTPLALSYSVCCAAGTESAFLRQVLAPMRNRRIDRGDVERDVDDLAHVIWRVRAVPGAGAAGTQNT